MKTLKKSIAVFAAALVVSAVTACPISAQMTESVKTYTYSFDTLKTLMFQVGLDFDVNADEKNGVIVFSSKDGNVYGDLVVSLTADDGQTQVYTANASVDADAPEVEYCITVCTDIDE